MTAAPFQIRLWGVRGSLPVVGAAFRKYGGNTLCIEMRCGDHVLLFDAGSGLMPAGAALREEGQRDITLFFTHFHYDHVMGLPFFGPLWNCDARLKVWSGHMAGEMTTAQMLKEFMRPPFFPVGPDYCPAQIQTGDFRAGDVLTPYPGITIRTGLLNHPGKAMGYRVEFGGRSVALITDTEHEGDTLDPTILDLITGCDLFLYDATFEESELPRYLGFGHSTWQRGVALAQTAGVPQVGFIHHAKFRTDADLDRIEAEAKALHPGAFCGYDLQVINV
ncbi:MAG: MBL fold metallo-hydrolase [Pseudomonadota bacterium]